MTTEILRMLQTLPATFGKLLVGFFETGCRRDHAVFPAGRVFIALPIQRTEHTFTQLCAFFQHSLCGVKTRIFKTWQLRHLLNIGQMLHVKQHVFYRGAVGHDGLPWLRDLRDEIYETNVDL